jgi:Co/Zn/Cd efflux system component
MNNLNLNQVDPTIDSKLSDNISRPSSRQRAEPIKIDNINERAAIIHMIGDMVQSIGVISAAIIIKLRPDW